MKNDFKITSLHKFIANKNMLLRQFIDYNSWIFEGEYISLSLSLSLKNLDTLVGKIRHEVVNKIVKLSINISVDNIQDQLARLQNRPLQTTIVSSLQKSKGQHKDPFESHLRKKITKSKCKSIIKLIVQ